MSSVAACRRTWKTSGRQRHDHRRVPLVRRQEQRIARALLRDDLLHRVAPLVPRRRAVGIADRAEDVAAIEEDARVDVPGDAVQRAVDDVRGPDAREVVLLVDALRLRDEGGQVVERAHGRELGDPGVSHLREVGRRITDVRGEQFLVRGAPRDLLDDDLDAGIAPLELGDQIRDHFPLAPKPPELDTFTAIVTRAAGEHQ